MARVYKGLHWALWLAAVSTLVLGSISVQAAVWRAPDPAAPQARLDAPASLHVQQRPLRADQLPPLPSTREHLRRSYDAPALDSQRGAACDINVFASSSGSALVANVRAAEINCLYELYDLAGTQAGAVFAEAKMVTIANAMQAYSASYPGDNSESILQLITFLRAGLFVQYYHSGDVGEYGAPWLSAIRPALDAFVANAHFTDVNDAHGKVLTEFVILIDSSAENAHQLGTVEGILQRYGPGWSSFWYMRAATNAVFTVLFRGHYNADFQALVQGSGSGVIDTLASFIADNRNADIGSEREYLLQNAAGELARFLQYGGSLHGALHPKVKALLDSLGLTGPGAGIYVRAASVTDSLDHAHCSYFNLCTFAADLEAVVLPAANARECSPTLRVRSQALTSAQLDVVCATVDGEEGYFHTIAATGQIPVADDFNDRLEMVIFHSSIDYETYSGVIFGNDTNNGGIYLEGDPADPGNQARFLAYEAEWLRPAFEVWNLTHEYIHYLDGRFNWHGGFGDLPQSAPYSAIWYVEGFAEYLSYSYRGLVYASAVSQAANPDRFSMAELFNTEYSTDYARTYQWGYMAARFMFERHRDEITDLYAVSRPGNYQPGYRNWLDGVRNTHDAEFREWVVCFASHNGDTSSCGGVPGDRIFAHGFEAASP